MTLVGGGHWIEFWQLEKAKGKLMAGQKSITEQLADLAALHADGTVNDEEFAAAKARILGEPGVPSGTTRDAAKQAIAVDRAVEKDRRRRKGNQFAVGCLALVGIVVLLAWLGSGPSEGSKSKANSISNEKTAAECLQDLKCAGNKFVVEAGIDCRRPVERLAKYSFKWTDSWYESKFDRFRWKDKTRDLCKTPCIGGPKRMESVER